VSRCGRENCSDPSSRAPPSEWGKTTLLSQILKNREGLLVAVCVSHLDRIRLHISTFMRFFEFKSALIFRFVLAA
jgi:hypothetical protein